MISNMINLEDVNPNTKKEAEIESDSSPYPIEVFPMVARDAVEDCCRLRSVDHALAGSFALGIASAAIGKGIYMKDKYQTYGNLYILTAAESGTGKSVSMKMFRRPFDEADQQRIQEHEKNDLPDIEAEISILKQEMKKLKGGKECDKATRDKRIKKMTEKQARINELERIKIPPCLYTTDFTTQALANLLQKDECMAILSYEAGTVYQNIKGRYNEGKGDDNLLLKGYSLDSCYIDRKGSQSIELDNPCLSMCLTGTPEKLKALFSNERLLVGGFLPRCLVLESESEPEGEKAKNRRENQAVWKGWSQLIHTLINEFRDRKEPAVIDPSTEASEVFRNYFNTEYVDKFKNNEIPSGCERFRSRDRENAMRIAVVLHCMEHAAKAPEIPMSEKTAKVAVNLAEFYARQSEVLSYAGRLDKQRSRLDKLTDILQDNGGNMTVRELKRRGFDSKELKKLQEEFPARLKIETRKPEGAVVQVRSYR